MSRSKLQLIEEYKQFRKAVEGFREGSNKPDPQLRAVYDQWIKDSAEWEDARAAFSLYCRLNRLLNSDFVNHVFEFARDNDIKLSGAAADFREKDTVEVIGSWLLLGIFPNQIDLRYERMGGSGSILLIRINRADDGRFKLDNAEEKEFTESLSGMLG